MPAHHGPATSGVGDALRRERSRSGHRDPRHDQGVAGGLPVKYFLDVNSLIAWQHPAAEDHEAFHTWAAPETSRAFATCAQVELGFLRVSMQAFG
jgi:hypothetical protein